MKMISLSTTTKIILLFSILSLFVPPNQKNEFALIVGTRTVCIPMVPYYPLAAVRKDDQPLRLFAHMRNLSRCTSPYLDSM